MEEQKLKWGIVINKMDKTMWSLGIAISIWSEIGEGYIYVNLIKWSISIGRLWKQLSTQLELYLQRGMEMKDIMARIKCLFGWHDESTAFSWKTGQYKTYCKRCGKVL